MRGNSVKRWATGIVTAVALGVSGVAAGTENYTGFMAWEGIRLYDTETGFLGVDEYAVIDGVYWHLDDHSREATTTAEMVAGKTEVDFVKQTNIVFYRNTVGELKYKEIPLDEYRRLGRKDEKFTATRDIDPTLGGLVPVADAAISTTSITNNNAVGNVASISFSHDTGVSGNDRAVVVSATTQRATLATATVGGNSMTRYANASGRAFVFTYDPEGAVTGSQTVVVTSSNSWIYASAHTLYGTSRSTLVDDSDTSTGPGTTPSVTLTTTVGGMAFDATYHEDNDGANSIGTDQIATYDVDVNSNQSRLHTYKPADATTETMTATFSSDSFWHSAVSIAPEPVSGGGGSTPGAGNILWLD